MVIGQGRPRRAQLPPRFAVQVRECVKRCSVCQPANLSNLFPGSLCQMRRAAPVQITHLSSDRGWNGWKGWNETGSGEDYPQENGYVPTGRVGPRVIPTIHTIARRGLALPTARAATAVRATAGQKPTSWCRGPHAWLTYRFSDGALRGPTQIAMCFLLQAGNFPKLEACLPSAPIGYCYHHFRSSGR